MVFQHQRIQAFEGPLDRKRPVQEFWAIFCFFNRSDEAFKLALNDLGAMKRAIFQFWVHVLMHIGNTPISYRAKKICQASARPKRAGHPRPKNDTSLSLS